MVTIQIHESLAEKLTKIGARENRSVAEVVESILEAHIPDQEFPGIGAAPGSLAAIIQTADEADVESGYSDTAENSREFLENHYGEHLSTSS